MLYVVFHSVNRRRHEGQGDFTLRFQVDTKVPEAGDARVGAELQFEKCTSEWPKSGCADILESGQREMTLARAAAPVADRFEFLNPRGTQVPAGRSDWGCGA